VIFFLARLGLVTPKGLRTKRKYAILAAFMLSAFLTPPDLFTQTFMAGPLIVLYEVGIWIAVFFGKKRAPESEA
jgi:sec-independent protein translocase protein TatC